MYDSGLKRVITLRMDQEIPYGGRITMKKLILGLLIVTPVLTCTVNTSGNANGPGALNFKEFERSIHERFDVDPQCKLSISVDDAELEILGWDQSEVGIEGAIIISAPSEEKADKVFSTFRLEDQEDEITMRIDANSVRIETRMFGCSSVRTCHALVRCTIHVPYAAMIDLDLDDGQVDLSSLAGEIHIDGDDLSIVLNGIKTDMIKLNTDDGRIEGTDVNGRIEINTDDAVILLRESICHGMEISLDDGSVEVETPIIENEKYRVSADDANVTMRISGDVHLDIDVYKDNGTFESDFPIKGELGENKVAGSIGNGGAKLSISTDDGDIRLLKKD